MARVRVLILRSAGANCDLETEHAWRLAGTEPSRIHIRRLIERRGLLSEFQILTIPGGFSYGDDIAAGTILSVQLARHLSERIADFVDRGNLVLGICNGFQVLVKAGLLPGRAAGTARTCTIAGNEPAGFQDRWLCLRAEHDRCPFLEAGRTYEMPIAHGEGRVTFDSPESRDRAIAAGAAVMRYTSCELNASHNPCGRDEPYNPNGSEADIAGMCDETGRVLGLMPHPERFVTWTQHPCWTSRLRREEGDGLGLFRRGAAFLS